MSPRSADKNTKNVLESDFLLRMHKQKNEPLATFRTNELNICSYKYKNRLTTTQTKEEILICSLWHLLEAFFVSQKLSNRTPPEHLLHNSRMLSFGMFQRKIRFVLLKELPQTIPKSAKQIAFPKNCPPRTLPGLIPY